MQSFLLNSIKEALKHWYIPLIVGILFVAVSIVAFTSPVSSFLVLSMLFSLSFLFSGLSEIVFAIANKNHLLNWAWSLVFGIITFMAGVLLLLNPSLTMTFLAYYIGFVILFRSISSISYAFDIKNYGGLGWGLLLFLGILGAVVSFILIWNPIFAGLSIVILVALNFLFGGLFNIYLALQLRKIHKYSKELSPELRERLLELENEIRNEVNS